MIEIDPEAVLEILEARDYYEGAAARSGSRVSMGRRRRTDRIEEGRSVSRTGRFAVMENVGRLFGVRALPQSDPVRRLRPIETRDPDRAAALRSSRALRESPVRASGSISIIWRESKNPLQFRACFLGLHLEKSIELGAG